MGIGIDFSEWQMEGKIVFDEMPSEEFYTALEKYKQKNGDYVLSTITHGESDESNSADVEILGFRGHMSIRIKKGEQIA